MSVNGDKELLTWLFLMTVWETALHIHNAGNSISKFYDLYRQCHKVSSSVLPSMRNAHPGLGELEKKEAQEARVLQEKGEEVAKALWEAAGRPEGGHASFIRQALDQLNVATGRK